MNYQACLDPNFKCCWPDNCPCFQDPDKAPPSPEIVDEIICDLIGTVTLIEETLNEQADE